MTTPFHPMILGKRYLSMLRAAESTPRNQISAANELRPLFPGTGDTHQLTSHDLTVDDAVLTIAAVLLGVSQIRYPYKIALGDLNFYESLGEDRIQGSILPATSDAFISLVDLDKWTRGSNKRNRNDSSEEAATFKGKRRKLPNVMAGPSEARNVVLAICEADEKDAHSFTMDLAAIRPRTPPESKPLERRVIDPHTGIRIHRPLDRGRLVEEVSTAVRSTNWHQGAARINEVIRHIAMPCAPERYEIHAAILHAWAYILDLPINPNPRFSIAQYDAELLDLFNVALRGQLTYALLKRFLKDTGYLYPAENLQPFQCIRGKYRHPLWRFRSVEIRGPPETAKLPADQSISMAEVRNAIGTVWRATFRKEFSSVITPRYGLADESNVVYAPAPTNPEEPRAPLVILHRANVNETQFTYVATADIQSSEDVVITHFGVDIQRVLQTEIQALAERTVSACGWHGGVDVTRIRFRHHFAASPNPADARESSFYAVFFAWCIILGIDIVPSWTRISAAENLQEVPFSVQAEEVINAAFAGKASVAMIKDFLGDYGITSDTVAYPGDSKLFTCEQPASTDALKEFIRKERATQKHSISVPDTPSVSGTSTGVSQTANAPAPQSTQLSSEVEVVSSGYLASSAPATVQSVPRVSLPKPVASKAPSPTTGQAQTSPGKGKEAEKAARKGESTRATRPKSKSKSPPKPRRHESPSKSSPKQGTGQAPEPPKSTKPLKSPPKQSTGQAPEPPKSAKPLPPATVLPWGEYRNPAKFQMYDASDHGSKNWMEEFRKQLEHCNAIRTQRRAVDPMIPERRFTDENGAKPSDGAEAPLVGDLIISLWKPMYDRTIKFGLVDINYVRFLQDQELSRNNIQAAVGGPYPLIMAMHMTSLIPSPLPWAPERMGLAEGTDMGHFWLGVATIRQEDMEDANGEATLREATQQHPIHVDVQMFDSLPLLREPKQVDKARGLVQYSGWAVGSRRGTDNHGGMSLIPRHWNPTVTIHDEPCPEQAAHKATKRNNACGLLTTLNTWMVLLDLPIPAERGTKHRAIDFYKHLIMLFDLALAGSLTTRTIQAFVNAYQYIQVVQPLDASVVDAQTEDPQNGHQLMVQLVQASAYDPDKS